MSSSDIFVGIDLSKSELEIGLLPQTRTWKLSNDEWGLTQLVKRLAALRPRLVAVEATGERTVQVLLEEAGLSVRVVSFPQMRNFLNSLGVLAKTDAIDALVLARYAQSLWPEARRGKDKETKELEALLIRRHQLAEMLTTEKDRLGNAIKRVRGDIEAHVSWLEKCLKQIDNDTNGFIKSMPIWGRKQKVIQIVPGAGPNWATMLLTLLPQLEKLHRRRITPLAGLAPFNLDSDKIRGRRYIQEGRTVVTAMMYITALVSTRSISIMEPFYHCLTAAGEKPKVVISACMGKLLNVLNSMIRKGDTWDHLRVTRAYMCEIDRKNCGEHSCSP